MALKARPRPVRINITAFSSLPKITLQTDQNTDPLDCLLYTGKYVNGGHRILVRFYDGVNYCISCDRVLVLCIIYQH